MAIQQSPRKMISTQLVGYCLDCNVAHLQEETIDDEGVLRCKETGNLVDPFDRPVPIAVPEEPGSEPERTIAELVRIGILDLAFHAQIDLKKNKAALEEIIQKFTQLLEQEGEEQA